MDTNTIDQNTADARSSLMGSISDSNGFAQYKDNSASEASSPADSTLKTDSDSRVESEAAEQVTNQQPSQPEKEGVTNTSNEVATNQPDTQAQNPQSRVPVRIQQLLEQNKAKDSKLQELERKVQELSAAKQPQGEAKVEHLIPQPTPPQITKNVLAQLIQKAKASGNQELFDQCQEQMEQWRNHELEMIRWEIKHGEATKKHNNDIEFYKQEAFKQVPELKDGNSPVSKEYAGIRGYFQKELPELLKKPVSEFICAKVASWKHGDETKSARLVAMESDLKKAKEQIEKLTKGSMPLDSKTRTEVSANVSQDSTLKDAKENLLKGIRDANVGFGAQTM